MDSFDIFRYKQAGMTNLGLGRVLKFKNRHQKDISLYQMGQVAGLRSISDFVESYQSQDVSDLKQIFRQFPSFSILDQKVYPDRLREIYNPPSLLFYQGNLELLKKPKLAIVGSRDSTQVGILAVQKLIGELKQAFVIVSGLAKGVDSAAHLSAIKSGTSTIAVIGTGLDLAYPVENQPLQEYIGKEDLVLTEYAPGQGPKKHHFPERNRVIAGLVRGVVVVEAKYRSGSLITCERAMEEGRDVFAVPGDITNGKSDGCHFLIQEGAKLVFNGQDILDEYSL